MAVHSAAVSPVIEEQTELEVTCRKSENATYYFIFNFKDKDIPLPAFFDGLTDLLTGKTLSAGTILKQYDALLVSLQK